MAGEFLRRTWSRYSKLGKRRKKKQVWRRPTGRDNKMREKRRGYPAPVSIGYRKNKIERNKISDKTLVTVKNISDLGKVSKEEIVIIGKVGKKKKLEIVKKAREKKIQVLGLNLDKFIKENEKTKKETKSESKDKK